MGGHVKLRYLDRFRDHTGVSRVYFRRKGMKRVLLPGDEGSPEFMAAYEAALAGEPIKAKARPALIGPVPEEERTFRTLVDIYYRTPLFLRLSPSTVETYTGIIDRFLAQHGNKRVDQMRRVHVKTIMGSMSDTPAAANNLVKKIRILMRVAIDMEWRIDDPTHKVETFDQGEYHTWTEDEIAAFEDRWKLGSPQRTAMALHLYTGQRRGDVCRMKWPEQRFIEVEQEKTGAKLVIPIHPNLTETLTAWPRECETILYTSFKRAFSNAGYGNFMQRAIKSAGLPRICSSHGLRKAAARRLAEAGCTEKQIAAITGHKTLAEVARYTRAANQVTLAQDAMDMQVAAAQKAADKLLAGDISTMT